MLHNASQHFIAMHLKMLWTDITKFKGDQGKIDYLVVSLHIQSHHPNANPNYKSCTSFWTSLSQQA